jgi:ribonuclease P protein component
MPMSADEIQRLRRRADFLKAATGSKAPAAPFVLQAVKRGEDGSARIGFTVSKKVGNAVERNRVRRRLREIVKRSAALLRPGYDYVVVGRRVALQEPFDHMIATFDKAVRRVHAAPSGRDTRPRARS